MAQEPAEQHAKNSTKKTHHAGFDKEQLLDVGIGCAKSFQYAYLPMALKNSHNQCVDDPECRDGECQTAEYAQQ